MLHSTGFLSSATGFLRNTFTERHAYNINIILRKEKREEYSWPRYAGNNGKGERKRRSSLGLVMTFLGREGGEERSSLGLVMPVLKGGGGRGELSWPCYAIRERRRRRGELSWPRYASEREHGRREYSRLAQRGQESSPEAHGPSSPLLPPPSQRGQERPREAHIASGHHGGVVHSPGSLPATHP